MILAPLFRKMETPETGPTPYWALTLALVEAEQELALAQLEQQGAESFWQEDDCLHAYFAAPTEFTESGWRDQFGGAFAGWQLQENRNWNAEWEANSQPIAIGKFCLVRPEHQPSQDGFALEVVSTPRMAFGTGHHETTQLMIQALSQIEVAGRSVLDLGCGTGVLGIVASKLGAAPVTFIDIDPLATEQATYNCQLNGCQATELLTGGADLLAGRQWPIILANINRNVLMADGPAYAKAQRKGDCLVLSGFMDLDEQAVVEAFTALGYRDATTLTLGLWRAVIFQRC